MPHSDPTALALLPHRKHPAAAVQGITARARVGSDGELRLEYVMSCALARVRLPPQGCGGRAQGLWAHTCFEAFVAPAGSKAYLELNFSPSGQWAAYSFSAYREGMRLQPLRSPPQMRLASDDGRLALEAMVRLPLARLQASAGPRATATLAVGLAAVVEEDSGALSYWALEHRRSRPDFHDRRAFSLELPYEPTERAP